MKIHSFEVESVTGLKERMLDVLEAEFQKAGIIGVEECEQITRGDPGWAPSQMLPDEAQDST